ncbi:MAG: ABC transporter ATP-binding protein [Rickettsiales bacterium]|nr:ABC transporter ATP-binding protein [Rickettsiales bacterium]
MNIDNINLKKYILVLVSKYKIYFLASVCLYISAAIFEISVDYKIKEIIDAIASKENAELSYLLFLFVFYNLIFHGVFFISRLLDAKYMPMIIEQTITDIYSKTVRHSLHWFDSHLSGEISNKIADFQSSLGVLISHFFDNSRAVAAIFIALFFLFKVNIWSALLFIVFIAIHTPLIYFLLRKQMQLQQTCINARQETIGIVNDSITNIFGIKIIGNILTEFKLKLKPSITKWVNWDRKTRKYDAYFVDNADTAIVVVMSAAQIYLLAYLYRNGYITAGGFAFIAMMTLKIHVHLDKFLESLLFNINPSIAQLRSSYNFVNTPLGVKDKPNAHILNDVRGVIKYSKVNFSYGKKGKLILSKFNLDIRPRERLGIVGMSGAGKTTLIKCLLRYFDVGAGKISIDDIDIKDISQESLREIISIIPQDITMFHRSINENLRLAKYNASDVEIINACKKAKIHRDILQMPYGYKTVVGERGVKLSGGQRQRVAIARAILKNSPILILDEATSSLDTPTEQLIQDSLNEMLEDNKATVIAVAHRLSTLKHMDRIIVLDKGKIVEEGTHNGLIRKQDGFYKKLWEMQAI